MDVTLIERRTGKRKTMPERYAKILARLGKHVYADRVVDQSSEPSFEPEAPPKRRGRPPKAKSEE